MRRDYIASSGNTRRLYFRRRQFSRPVLTCHLCLVFARQLVPAHLYSPISLSVSRGVGRQGVGILSSCLPGSLVDLDLSDNPAMGEKGGSAMGRFLLDFVRSANLRRLDISRCNLGNSGLVSLAEGVAAAPGLEWLGIAGNLRGSREGERTGEGKLAMGKKSNALSVVVCFVW